MTRQKTINQLKNLKEHCKEMSGYADHCVWEKDIVALDFAIDSLRAGARPSKKGKWEKDGHGHVVCSVCGNAEDWRSRNYCPVCGTKMESEDCKR